MTSRLLPAAAAAALLALAVPGAAGAAQASTLEGRALLPADASAPAPFDGTVNTDPAPRLGARQPVGGFSALLDGRRPGTYFAMPDNGFGSKANSRSFLLRVYTIAADLETARGGSGTVEVLDQITLRDPDRRLPFPIVTEGSTDRLLTGGDLDIESVRIARDGTLWFGEEFGPFLVHTDATGRVLEAPFPVPGVRSPDDPTRTGQPVNLGRSNGIEAMALSRDGKRLLPVLEGAVSGDDPRVRRALAFDLATRSWRPGFRPYRVADPSFLVSDVTALDAKRFVALERDNFQGVDAKHKRAFVVRLEDEAVPKTEALDLLAIGDPDRISEPAAPGDVGIGDPFAMPYVTIEAVLPLGGERLAIVNDTNFGSRGRNPGAPDPSDLIVVRAPALR